ncbi:MAG: hypothetical protein QOJ29_4523 [Thermoleophilaceae bacterium]|nr:hypothetical protein [Thermoleophilaceae bacterium]
MAGKLIVLDAGGQGAIWTDDRGTRPVPLPPGTLRHLKAVRDLLAVQRSLGAGSMAAQDMAALVTRVSNLAVDRIEGAFGELEPEDSLIYQDGRGGFTCGSTGAAPRAFRWRAPAATITARQRSLVRRALSRDSVELARQAADAGIDLREVLEDPEAVANRLKVPISERSAKTLRTLAPSRLTRVRNETDRAVVEFMFAVFADGRFVDTWATEPAKVARALGIDIEAAAINRILDVGAALERIDPRRIFGAGDDDSDSGDSDSGDSDSGDHGPPPGDSGDSDSGDSDSGDHGPGPGDDSPGPGDDSPGPGDSPGDDSSPPIDDFVMVRILTYVVILIVVAEPGFEEELGPEELAKF